MRGDFLVPSLFLFTMNFDKLLANLEFILEMQDLKDMGLNEEEILGYLHFFEEELEKYLKANTDLEFKD